ncbi:HoxN/HupN/NixA family nickel/cobalt transporter [Sporolactobacillus sp. CPB3-1]|uniref:Nickel/cobalt efflux system n=1 Tax=Sporolactobacillus mangiferae TaxID=2940498 RepID=A0ABT0MCX5_9BACL|nr:HoxN/HupN/NixA family nickel/cobalt transporter [Sporolactobacillus mangiferae]MCL1632732.1 HoxN/HupN/NixA family nickel/cobalt transporter [Sporolactobacillus mangiferae]
MIKKSLPYYTGSIFLHFAGLCSLFFAVQAHPAMLGLGLVAYTLGLRHAFDADHIAAIDNTVRKLTEQKQNPMGVGFYFSLGHSSVVFLMAAALAISIQWAQRHLPLFSDVGGMIGAIVSGSFLMVIAFFNLLILIDLWKQYGRLKQQAFDQAKMEQLLQSRGLLVPLLRPLFAFINKSWHVLPLGFLFGLGFDTATEISLLAISAESAQMHMSLIAVLALPILFAAGMNVMDTTDSVMMSCAYRWALDTPVRKIYYNLTVTAISVAAAVLIGLVELSQVAGKMYHLQGGIWRWVQQIDLNWLGYALIILFLSIWAVSYVIWKMLHASQRWGGNLS